MPTVLQLKDYRFFFFKRELGELPRIHVESGDKYATFLLKPVELDKSVGYNAEELGEIKAIIAANMALAMGKWNEYFAEQD
ncbi:MAG: DUF4160 domain-containing protein [Dehalococcoidales bacterium]|nr:DUF4160 domain-containing protein [Dehalococcoidales bacterium]